jgi:hypothetical protein
MSWKITEPPKKKTVPVRLRYRSPTGNIYTGDFFWSDTEQAWVEVIDGQDGTALYESNGYKVLGWKG